jgi:RNA polymerase sigma-70 factor (ECF subfamily)
VNNDQPEWLKQALRGDQEAFGLLVDTYQRPVYNLCYRMLGDTGEAEDAAQETFWRAYQHGSRYDFDRSFMTWLLAIAAHYCIDQQRKKHLPSFSIDLMVEEMLPDPTPEPEKSTSKKEEANLLQKVLAQLKSEDRAVIILRYWYEMSEDEIAQTLSTTTSAVKSRLHRARLMIAQQYKVPEAILASGGNSYEPSTL